MEHLEQLLNRPASLNLLDIEAAHTDLPIDSNPPTIEEIRMVIRQINNGKAAAPDDIPLEALKSHIQVTSFILHVRFRKIWYEEQVAPTD